jgi:phosphoribosylformylglycinamidine cyclo-ligase
MRYRDAGVDIEAADALKSRIGALARATWTSAVQPLAGGFAGFMAWPSGDGFMAATMDGVGTKLHLARAAGRLADASADLVYHCADDLLVHGARPLAFLDYLAQSRLEPDALVAMVDGLSRACREVGAVLLGGETAEMPDTYSDGAVDLAGCMIGHASRASFRDGSAVRPGDRLLGLGSNGLHTNGYSLARAVVERAGVRLAEALPGGGGESIGDALLASHRWYGPALWPELELAAGPVHALAHVTGGGIAGNLVRVLPRGTRARVRAGAWPRPPLFRWIMEAGDVPEDDARETFNLGIGMVVVCAPGDEEAVASRLTAAGERVFAVGDVVAGGRDVSWEEGP